MNAPAFGNSKFPTELLGRYSDIKYLSRGGMGLVFAATDTVLDKGVVIKTLIVGGYSQHQLLRFQKEAKAAGRLSHRNIVIVRDFGITGAGDPYMVMEHIDGRSLSEHTKEHGILPLADTLVILIQVLNGIQHAHNHGVIHRDLKPSNIMLLTESSGKSSQENELHVKLIDFGTAHLRKIDEEGFDSSSGRVAGSPAYMSPEMAAGKSDHRSDVYSFGCVAFELLTGSIPYTADSALALLKKHVEAPIPSLYSQERSGPVYEKLDALVQKCLAKQPAERFSNADEILPHLFRLLEEVDSTREVAPPETITPLASAVRLFIPTSTKDYRRILFLVVSVAGALALSFLMYEFTGKPIDSDARAQKAKTGKNMVDQMAHGNNTFNEYVKTHFGTTEADEVTNDDLKTIENRITDDGILRLGYSKITSDGLKNLIGKSFYLLDVRYTQVDDSAFPIIRKMPEVRDLTFEGCDHITGKGLRYLCESAVYKVRLDYSNVTDEGLEELATLPRLVNAAVKGCKRVTDKGITHLANAPILTSIDVSDTKISSRAVAKLTNLETVGAAGCDWGDEDLRTIAQLPALKSLNVCRSPNFSSKGLDYLRGHKGLERLRISLGPHLTSKDIERFRASLPSTIDVAAINDI